LDSTRFLFSEAHKKSLRRKDETLIWKEVQKMFVQVLAERIWNYAA